MSAAFSLTWEESAADGREVRYLVKDWLAGQQPGQRLDYYALERWTGGRSMRPAIAAALAELYASGFLRPVIRRLIDDQVPVELQHVACDDTCATCRGPIARTGVLDAHVPTPASQRRDVGGWPRMPYR